MLMDDGADATPPSSRLRRASPWAIAVLGVLVWIGVDRTVWLFRAPLPLSTRSLGGSIEQLTFEQGIEALPSLSPDGGWIAYRSDAEGTGDIMVRRIGDAEARNLTRELNAEESDPAFSPDGRQIAFRSTHQGGGIFISDRSGGGVRRITNFGASPAWTPNGRAIVFATRSSVNPRSGAQSGDADLPSGVRAGVSEGWMVDVETRAVSRIVRGDFRQPSVSPDGTRIAYWAAPPLPATGNFVRRRETGLWTVGIAGIDARQVAVSGSSGVDWNPVWSSDGEFLYFLSDRGGRVGIWRAAMDHRGTTSAGRAVAMALDAGRAASLAIAANGRRLAWSTAEWSPTLLRIDYDADSRATRGNPAPVRAGGLPFRCAEPSPDGTLLAGVSDHRRSDIYVVNISDGVPKAVTRDAATEGCPRWSADGSMIAFFSRADGLTNTLRIARADGTVLHQAASVGGEAHPVWAPDGTSLIAMDLQRRLNDIFSVDRDGTPVRVETLPALSQGFTPFAWSRDGVQIAGTSSGAIWVYRRDSRTYDRLAPGGHPTWLRSGRRLVFASEGRLVLFDVPSRFTREILALPDLYLDAPLVSADDRQLYFSRNAPEANLWLATLR
jgi:Tol biopolymer transport system component